VRWVLFVLVALVAVIVIIAIIGARLPREHRASRTVTLPRPPADVWAAVTKTAGAASVPVDILESRPPFRQVTRVKESEKNFGGTWTIEIAPVAGGSTLTITEDGWVANPVFRFISRYVMGYYASIDAVLKSVTKELGSS
jgi:hypothetical protein